ncbi:M4 family metallopeptidase, partial [Ulvibacter litoralis]
MTQFNPRKTYRILFVFILLLSTGNLFSQKKGAKPTIHEGITQTVPSLVILDASQQYSTKNSKQIFKEIFHLSSENRFTKVKVNKGKGDYVHEKHQQFFKDIKVEGGISTLHTQNGLVTSISSELYRIDNSFNSNPSLSANEAFNLAIEHTGATTYLWEDAASAEELGYEKPVGELVILPTFYGDDTILKLAYKFEIFTLVPMGGGDLYMDANSGEALFFNNRVKHYDTIGHDGSSYEKVAIATCEEEPRQNTTESLVAATAATRYSGTRTIETRNEGANYSLNYDANQIYTRNAYNQGPGNGVPPYIANYTEFLDTDNNWTAGEFHNANKDDAALDAHWGAMMVYDYWNAEHGRDSYDGAGSQIRSYVHVDTDYDNAFWYYNTMSYGDGSGNSNPGSGLFDALTCLDVAAHELGHGVTEYTANLAYQRESGGMNEGFSDIWGAAIEHFAKGTGTDANPDANVWAIGEEIMRNGSASLRSMSNPKSQGQPDTYGGTYWINPNCGTPSDANDYCGVHTNSGVLNHWFYLVTVGGSGTNDVADTYNVTGIGMTKASTIAYDVLDNYLGANSTYADARDFSIQSATVLYGDCSQELVTITDAWHAVGVGAVYSGGAPSLTLSASTTCVTSGTTTLSGGTATGGVYSGLGVTDDGNGTTFTFDPTVAGVGTHTITYTRACGAGSASDTDTIEVTDGLPVLICKDISVTLDGGGDISITASDVVSNLEYDTTSYTLDTSGTFSPETITGTTLSLGDDAGSSLLPIGFDFDFYGTTYSNFYIASNGFISFDNDGTSGAVSYTPTALADGGAPNNMIALVWDDLSPNQSGTIKYETIGIAPNRKLIVDFIDVPLYTASPPSAYEVTSQLQLFEGSQRIEIHTSKATNGGTSRTQGIENATGTAATPTTGRNLANWSLPDGSSDYVAYVPSNTGSIVDNCGNPVTLSVNKTDFTCKDIGDVTVTITADDGNGGISTCDATVTVVGPTTVFTGSWDNGTPNSTKKAIFSNNYSTSVADIDACVCEITNNAIITVGAGEYMKVDGNITVDAGSSLMIQHEGSVVQGDDSAIVSNNGSITVEKITPT